MLGFKLIHASKRASDDVEMHQENQVDINSKLFGNDIKTYVGLQRSWWS